MPPASTITTTTQTTAISFPFQRKAFYANGRFWVFYCDGDYMLWAHSLDGITWTVAQKTIETRSPTQTSGTWSNPTGAYADGGGVAQAYVGDQQDYYGYGFALSSTAKVTKVRVRLDIFSDVAGNVSIKVSWDGGTTWGPVHTQAITTTETTYFIDVTSDTEWTPTKTSNIVVRITAVDTEIVNLDWIPVEVTYYDPDQVVRASTLGEKISIWFDGTFLHYAYASKVANTALTYRRSTPNSDGTITWSAPEQTAVAAVAGVTYSRPFISVDSVGYPWISYATGSYPFVTKASTNDGSWTTQTDFPTQLSTTSNAAWATSVVPLTSQKMYVVYVYSAVTLKGRLWDGSVFGSEEAASVSAILSYFRFSVTTYQDDVHLVFDKNVATYDIIYRKRTFGVGWGSEEVIQTPGNVNYAPVLSTFGPGDLYCFWMGAPTSERVYYKRNIGGTWDSTPTLWITEVVIEPNDRLTCFYQAYGSHPTFYIGLVYIPETSSPYSIKFDFITLTKKEIQYSDGLVSVDVISYET